MSMGSLKAKPVATNLYDLNFKNLKDFGSFKTSNLIGKKSLWIIFQPDCQSCRSQFKDLKCLPKDISVVAVGINGSREKLSKELKPSKFITQQVLASKDFESEIEIEGTPTLLFIDEQGVLNFQGLAVQSCKMILERFRGLSKPL